jgi:hypothetical protein
LAAGNFGSAESGKTFDFEINIAGNGGQLLSFRNAVRNGPSQAAKDRLCRICFSRNILSDNSIKGFGQFRRGCELFFNSLE